MNARTYKKCREDLLFDVLGLAGLIGNVLPVEARPGSNFANAGGSQWNNRTLKMVADKLQDVLYRFDQAQHSLGLWEHDARFGHGPAGSTNTPIEGKPTMTTKKDASQSSRPQAAPKPSKRPKAIDGSGRSPSKQKPRHGGGSGYSSNGHHG